MNTHGVKATAGHTAKMAMMNLQQHTVSPVSSCHHTHKHCTHEPPSCSWGKWRATCHNK